MPPAEGPSGDGTVEAPSRDGAVLTVSEVAVRFGGVSALSDVSLTVKPGTVTGLIGPNGAGKTTLFNVISGLQTPGRGTVRLFDTDVTAMKPHHRARLGLARTFQRLELFGSLSVAENVQVGLESGLRWRAWAGLGRLVRRRRSAASGDGSGDGALTGSLDAESCERLLEGVGLAGRGAQNSASMSTGSARMVELARALAIGPKLLLLDEPGSGLDEVESDALGKLLSKLAADGMAVLLVEHDMELVMRICDHIYVLDFGDIIASGTPDEIRTDPAVQAAYLGEAAPEPPPRPLPFPRPPLHLTPVRRRAPTAPPTPAPVVGHDGHNRVRAGAGHTAPAEHRAERSAGPPTGGSKSSTASTWWSRRAVCSPFSVPTGPGSRRC